MKSDVDFIESETFLEIKREVYDMILLTNMISKSGVILDGFKYFKLSFFIDFLAFNKNLCGFNSLFYKYTYGAYSKELEVIRRRLMFSKFISGEEIYAKITDIGHNKLNEINEMIEFTKTEIYDVLENDAKTYYLISGIKLKKFHYGCVVKGKSIENYSLHDNIFSNKDFESFDNFIENLDKKTIMSLYSLFLFPETHGKKLVSKSFDLDEMKQLVEQH